MAYVEWRVAVGRRGTRAGMYVSVPASLTDVAGLCRKRPSDLAEICTARRRCGRHFGQGACTPHGSLGRVEEPRTVP